MPTNLPAAHLCPVCKTPAPTTIAAFTCWGSHEPSFWDTHTRRSIAEALGCSGPRVSQMVFSVTGDSKKYVREER